MNKIKRPTRTLNRPPFSPTATTTPRCPPSSPPLAARQQWASISSARSCTCSTHSLSPDPLHHRRSLRIPPTRRRHSGSSITGPDPRDGRRRWAFYDPCWATTTSPYSPRRCITDAGHQRGVGDVANACGRHVGREHRGAWLQNTQRTSSINIGICTDVPKIVTK